MSDRSLLSPLLTFGETSCSISTSLAFDSSDRRLLPLLEEYLQAIEADPQLDREDWMETACREFPELDEEIREGIRRIDCLQTLSSMKNGSLPQIADHVLHREIGRGGMGIVYEATDIALGRRVALKTMPSPTETDSKQLARFMIEAQAAARLEHPHITPIYRVGSGQGVHYLSMKLIIGQSLDELADLHAVPQGERIDWIIQAAEALDHAHACGVIHRDVKPSNLMVDQIGHLWINDFGLARITDAVSLTGSGDLVGTLAYMSPEQVSGDPVDRRTDVYALGLTLFELLTGRRAIPGTRRGEVLARIAASDAFHVSVVDRSIDRDLDTIVAKATARDPADRYTTAAQLAEDLHRFRQSRPILAQPPSLARRSSKWVKRHRQFVAAIAALLVLATCASWIATWRIATANRATRAAFQESQSNLRRTEDILDRFGLLAAESLRHVEGAEEVRRELLRQTLQYYEDFARQVTDDPRFTQQNAITHFRAAQIIAEIGAKDDAVTAYDRARQLFESADPLTPLGARTYALCLNNLAMLKAEAGKTSAAASLYRQAITRQRRLLETQAFQSPVDRQPIVIDLAKSHGNVGMTLIEAGQPERAVSHFEQGLAALHQLSESNLEAGLTEAMLLSNLGFANRGRDRAAAMTASQRAIDRLRQLHLNASPDPLTAALVVRSLASGLSNRAALTIDSGRNADAAQAAARDYRESIELLRALVKKTPQDRQLVCELAITENNLGRLLLRIGRVDPAIGRFQDAVGSLQRLCEADPQAEHYQSSLGGALHNLGRALATAGHKATATETLRRSIDAQKTALERSDRLAPQARKSRQELLDRTISDYQSLSHSS